ncbi:MaoC/PaaZ C-terminal domain-containing protein [Streptomyces sp. NPDC090106]|uniref:MaoC/PaaZ C-terminal domain-containing protein n=1 Tax=Streptomyces sp. NPDC090106 TaxID=3365946 RepID=UPI00380DD2C8
MFSVGQELAAGPRSGGFPEWNRFAAVNDEFVPLHMDDDVGRAAGYPGAIVMGRLQWSYVHRLLREWLPPEGRIETVALRFRAPTPRGARFDVRARVLAVRSGPERVSADLEVWVEDGAGVVSAPGTATVSVPVQR